jgi:diguanylate cyclase (GGDEF)-like protein
LRKVLRDTDSAARYGGEEFFLLLPGTSAAAAVQMAKRVQEQLAAAPPPAGPVTLSVGIAAYPVHGDDDEALLRAADEALYEAKRGGRNRFVVAGDELRATDARESAAG